MWRPLGRLLRHVRFRIRPLLHQWRLHDPAWRQTWTDLSTYGIQFICTYFRLKMASSDSAQSKARGPKTQIFCCKSVMLITSLQFNTSEFFGNTLDSPGVARPICPLKESCL